MVSQDGTYLNNGTYQISATFIKRLDICLMKILPKSFLVASKRYKNIAFSSPKANDVHY